MTPKPFNLFYLSIIYNISATMSHNFESPDTLRKYDQSGPIIGGDSAMDNHDSIVYQES